jgi:hypothetical protein
MIDRRSTLKNAVLLIALAGREEIIAVTHCRTPPSAISQFLAGDIGSPLLARFASRDLEPRHPGADIVLPPRDAGAIAATGEHVEPSTE